MLLQITLFHSFLGLSNTALWYIYTHNGVLLNIYSIYIITQYYSIYIHTHTRIYIYTHVYVYLHIHTYGLPRWLSGKESAYRCKRTGCYPWVWKIPWRVEWQPTPVSLLGKSHGQKSLVSYSHGIAESDTTEHTHTHAYINTCKHVYVCIYVYVCIHMCVCVYIYIYTLQFYHSYIDSNLSFLLLACLRYLT